MPRTVGSSLAITLRNGRALKGLKVITREVGARHPTGDVYANGRTSQFILAKGEGEKSRLTYDPPRRKNRNISLV